MKRLLIVLLVLPLALLASPDKDKKKKREWMTGTIAKAEMKSAGTFGYPMFWPVLYKTKYVWLYTIETDKITYELLWPYEMPLNVTINGTVEIAPGKNSTYYLMDDEERENRLMVFRKTAKPTPESPPGS